MRKRRGTAPAVLLEVEKRSRLDNAGKKRRYRSQNKSDFKKNKIKGKERETLKISGTR